jgi:acetolactate synthase-1/2/3 large subunit
MLKQSEISISAADARSGAANFLTGAAAAGMETCFANPGTTELAFVRSFDDVPGWRTVACLFEGVCTGAADGYGRILGRPALTLTHLGPGFANGLANLHNARRARTPIVNVIGDQMTWHRPFDAPLTSDIDALAGTVSAWVTTVRDAGAADALGREAVAQALGGGGRIATVVFPADVQAARSTPDATPLAAGERVAVPFAPDVDRIAARLRASRAPMLIVGGDVLMNERGLLAAHRVAAATNAVFYCETFPARIERGAALPAPERFPYFPEPATAAIAAVDLVVLAGLTDPGTYFGYAGYPSELVPAEKVARLAGPCDPAAVALEALADALGAPPAPVSRERARRLAAAGAYDPGTAAAAIAAWLPEDAIVSIEGGTCGYPFFTASAQSARHTVMTNTGGAIGQGLPVALGAAIAAPHRRTVCVQSDGSAQYTIQSLWTMARESLPITIVIAANARYAVLQNEFYRDGVSELTGAAHELTSLDRPVIDWLGLARGYGVPATAVMSTDELVRALDASAAGGGPSLIALELP